MNKKVKISLLFNILIVVLVAVASFMMFTGLKFMEDNFVLQSTKIGMFRFFTVDSNVFVGIVSLIFVICECEYLNGTIKEIPSKIYIFKFMATTAVALTLITVFGYLGPISKGGIPSMLTNSNLFFHLIIPILSITSFAFFEKADNLKFIYGIIPTAIYEVYYITNLLVHSVNGKVSPMYDWYWFAQGGIWQICIVGPLMLLITYIIALIIGKINLSVNKTKKE